ncbi:HypC/HybG/HupF family hydrogenase formation chaperone [Ideonella dechloratans]|uniref:HypC/HybG/HupF family hydrogenase formation chaperone n=1 Tax=Ideonella dechloratans TaxID=36863 RepID=UPI0035B3ADD5
MCIGLPMQVLATRPGFATVTGRGDTREVNTALVGERSAGDWVLVFIDGAREVISAERAAEVDATLDLIAQAMGDAALLPATPADDPGFELPSAWSAEQLAALTGQAR